MAEHACARPRTHSRTHARARSRDVSRTPSLLLRELLLYLSLCYPPPARRSRVNAFSHRAVRLFFFYRPPDMHVRAYTHTLVCPPIAGYFGRFAECRARVRSAKTRPVDFSRYHRSFGPAAISSGRRISSIQQFC